MRIELLVMLVCFCLPLQAQQRCGSFSCLEVRQLESGWQLRVIPQRPGIYACFIRYENTKLIDDNVTIALGPVRLKPGYPPSMVQFRCDPANSCPVWMREAALCSRRDTAIRNPQ
ncbi:hypothetical protein [Alteromonas sp. CYL-A6]|uniref:hypothetical protein n=1 Tax=Alteromonas nitratireducens TaxID=3390813 RepID=UPI0034AD419A